MRRTPSILVLVALLAAATLPGNAADCPALEGRWANGVSWAVATTADHVFFGRGTQLVAVDALDPLLATEVGVIDVGGVIRAIEISGHLALVAADEAGLVVVEIVDPSSMRVLSATGLPGHASGIAVSSGHAWVTDLWADLTVFDLVDPANPTQVGSLAVDGSPTAVAAAGTTVLLTEGTLGVRVIDGSVPGQPVAVALLDTAGDATGVTLVGTTAYIADGPAGLAIADLSNPANPTLLGTVATPGHATDVAVAGNLAWVAADFGRLRLIDISNPAAPTEVADVGTLGTAVSVATTGSWAWVAQWTHGLAGVDGSTPAQPAVRTQIPGAGESHVVSFLGDRAVVGDWSGVRMRVLDLQNPAAPTELGSVEVNGNPNDVAVASGRAVVALGWGPVAVVDLSDPAHPTTLGTVDTPGNPQSVAVSGDYAFVADLDGGLRVIDVSSPAQPGEVGSAATDDRASGVAVAAGYAFVADGSAGLLVFDVSVPSSPTRVATLELPGIALDVVVDGGYAVVAAYYSGVHVVDVSDPVHPALRATADMNGYARRVEVVNGLALVANSFEGLVVLDVSDPDHPAVIGSARTPGEGWDVAVNGDRALLADGAAGVTVFDVGGCSEVGTPPGADFSWTPASPRSGETVQFTDLSTGSPTGRSWWFSDDGSISTEANPVHVFATAGAFDVKLEVWSSAGTASLTRSVAVAPASGEIPPISYTFPVVTVVPAAAHVGGSAGTSWVTDLVLHNPATADVTAALFLMRADTDSSSAAGIEVTVPAGRSLRLPDVVATSFGVATGSGAILVGSDRFLVVSSRTYNNSASGTYGQYIPGYPLNAALHRGDAAELIQLEHDSRFRTNLGVANPTALTLDVLVELFSSDGSPIGQRTFQVPPWSYHQENGVFSGSSQPEVGDGRARVSSPTSGAQYFAYASVVDNTSGDPVFVAPVRSTGGVLWIPAAAHVTGANDTDWRTDLELMSPSGGATSARIELLRTGQGNPSPQAVDRTLAEGSCTRLTDAVSGLFGFSGSGALKISPSGGAVLASSRTFNQLADRTYGQLIPAIRDVDAVSWGAAPRLVQLAHSPDRATGFRTNLGLVNVSAVEITILIQLYAGSGQSLGQLTQTLPAFGHVQINDVFAQVTDQELDDAYAVVTTTTGDARYLAYGSVVDNRSGDPVFIPAVRVD